MQVSLPLVVVVTVVEVEVVDEFREDFSILFDLDSCCCLTTDIFFGDGDRAFSIRVFF